MVTRDADTPPTGVRGLVTMAHVLPRTPGRPGYLPCPGWTPPRPVAGVDPCRDSPARNPFA